MYFYALSAPLALIYVHPTVVASDNMQPLMPPKRVDPPIDDDCLMVGAAPGG